MGKIHEADMEIIPMECSSWDVLLNMAQENFSRPAYVYAILDYRVVFGWLADEKMMIHTEKQGGMEELTGTYVQELRIFNEEKELRVRRCAEGFRGRLLLDRKDNDSKDQISVMEEIQKLWGSVTNLEENWALLTSRRGEQIWVPAFSGEKYGLSQELGLKVKSYIQFQEAADKDELYRFFDERLCGICGWTGGE